MHALRQEILPPSGVEFSASLKLTPATIEEINAPLNATIRHEFTARVLCNVVVARSNLLRIFEVREELAPIHTHSDEKRERRSNIRRGTEAVEGEVAMDGQGEGFVNIAKFVSQKNTMLPPTVTRFYFVREHRLHGIITGMEGVRVATSHEDKLDKLLVSFKDAKIALLEWSDSIHDLVAVSIHTYERAPQLMSLDSSMFRTMLRVDPLSRCAALLLPKDAIAILPFHQSQAELDAMDQDVHQARDLPYSPSFILDLQSDVDQNLRNVIDFVFLPGFNNPTVAILFQTQETWTGRLKEFKDTARLVIFTLDIISQNYPIITSVEGLPHDSLSLLACSPTLGGVVIITCNSVVYVDQSSRRIALSVNGWSARISDLPSLPSTPEGQLRNIQLEGSRSAFVDDKTIFLILKDGTVHPVEITADGKSVSKLTIASPLAHTAIPTVVNKIGDGYLFLGSTTGSSVLLKTAHIEEEVQEDQNMESAPTAIVETGDAMDLDDDDDDDIYGTSKITEPATNGQSDAKGGAKNMRTVIHLSLCDSLPAYGPIADMAFSLARNGDRPVPELVAATGAGSLGGFTLFQRDLPVRTKRRLHPVGGARGMWSLPIRQPIKVGGISYERPVNPYQSDNDTLIISTDANPSPGLSRIAVRTANDVSITTRIPGTTIGAAPFFQRTAILHVMTNAIRVLEPDGTERQIIKDVDGNMPRPKIRACHISDPLVLILREDDSIGLFIETERGRIRRKDMSPMGDKTSRYLAGCFYTDTTGLLESNLESPPAAGGANQPVTTSQAAGTAGNKSQWLVLVRPQGIMEIWTLPKLVLVFSTPSLATLQTILMDSQEPPALSLPQDPPRKPEGLDIEQILIAPIGESSPQPHLLVFLRSGKLAIYELFPAGPTSEVPSVTRTSRLKVSFAKILSRVFEIQRSDDSEKSVIAEQKKISRTFIPFITSPQPGTTFSGVFFTGENPSWMMATNKGGLQLFPSGHSVVHAFTSCSLWESKGDFLLYTDEGPSLLEWVPDFQLDGPLPFRSLPRGRPYSSVVFEPTTSLIIAASSLQAKFASFDEDGNQVWEPDALNIADPVCDCSALELISPDLWITMDGYEFATNEYINDVGCVTLETASTESGSKDFVVVGTTIDRGEDLAAKGATYIFEIVEVVPDPTISLKRWYKLRLRCRDDAKGPVTAICGFNGYLVSSMGQKIFVRAFDLDERLVGVAFMDVGVYVTSLRTLKNLLLVGDAIKSVAFIAFQEDPYKLVLLAKDINHVCVTRADFFFADSELSIVTGDEEGVIRVYEYNPQDPESRDGRHLLLRSEFHAQCEYRTSTLIARRAKDDPVIPQAKLICGSTDGSLYSLTPVDEYAFKRLQLLQGQLTRNIQHVAGLNPKAFRIVRNDFVSKPLSKGILDGNLLAHFEGLPITQQDQVTRQIGTEREVVLRDWITLGGPW